jgi:chorismate mutase
VADVNALSPSREREQFARFERLSAGLDLPYPVVEIVFAAIRDQVLISHQMIKSAYESN